MSSPAIPLSKKSSKSSSSELCISSYRWCVI
jgi:hypothetical protein